MKLHAFKRCRARRRLPTQAHDLAARGPRGALEIGMKRRWVNDERVVTRCNEWIRHSRKESATVVMNL